MAPHATMCSMTEEKPLLPKQAAAAERDRQVRERIKEQTVHDLEELRATLLRDCKMCRATLAIASELCDTHKPYRSLREMWDDEWSPRRPRRRPDPVERVRCALGG